MMWVLVRVAEERFCTSSATDAEEAKKCSFRY